MFSSTTNDNIILELNNVKQITHLLEFYSFPDPPVCPVMGDDEPLGDSTLEPVVIVQDR